MDKHKQTYKTQLYALRWCTPWRYTLSERLVVMHIYS